MEKYITGIDIGGSHITAGIVEMASRTVVNDFYVRRKVDSKADAETILSGWCSAIEEIWEKTGTGRTPLGFAMPGPFEYANGICLIEGLDKYEALYGMNIREELVHRLNLPGDEICFRNDAEAFLEGELFCGAAQGYSHAIGITLGTGLGSAYSHNGVTCDAALSVILCKGEIIEAFVSTRGLIRNYERLAGKRLKDVKAIAALYDTEEAARKSFGQFADDLAWFLQMFIERENPRVLVIGGNIMQAWNLFMPWVVEKLSAALPQLPAIVKAALGENALLIGGACCFYQQGTATVPAVTLPHYSAVINQ